MSMVAQGRPWQDSQNLARVGSSRSGFLGGPGVLCLGGHKGVNEVVRAFSGQEGATGAVDQAFAK